ncbi:MAG: LPS export ABC transporter ATP-binding protein [Gammaproteobacteria bacterium]|nr:LPS export ABC transporter ATP-binding protein [Gammaproteobacteria bacterium]
MQTNNRLWAEQLAKTYKKRQVVQGVNIQVNSGEIVGLLGPNGAGKTTTFYMIVGLVQSDAGSIGLNNQDLTKLPMHARAQQGVGYLPQEASVFRGLTVEENILAVLQLRKDAQKQMQREICDRLLQDLQIEHIRNSKGFSLSGGERRRVEIARALAIQPQFILLDEPFAGVDPISVMDIQRLLKQLTERGIGLLITDHNVRETLGICSRAYILNQGQIIAEGTPDHLLNDQQVREVYLGSEFQL